MPGQPKASVKTAAEARAQRRLFDGAPPVIPHQNFGRRAACRATTASGMAVARRRLLAPPVPHDNVQPPGRLEHESVRRSATSTASVDDEFVPQRRSSGLPQDLRQRQAAARASRPRSFRIQILLRENCQACHTGPAAREEIRTTHPERENCAQCHVPRVASAEFAR